jgi:hypothetical protein
MFFGGKQKKLDSILAHDFTHSLKDSWAKALQVL